MKILVFSDSHGESENMERAFNMHPEADYVFHLGDGSREFESLAAAHPEKIFTGVNGNFEDFVSYNGVKSATLEIEGTRFFLCHGHRFGVKSSYARLEYYAAENGIDAVLFGHTHVPYEHYVNDLGEKPFYLFNPGSISHPHYMNPSYGIIEKRGGDLLFSVAYLDRR